MKFALYIICFLFLFSCQNNKVEKPPKPENLIPKDKMIDILYDMSIITASKGVAKRTLEREGVNPETFIFEKHSIDSLQFEESNKYYSFDLDAYESMYREVEKRIIKDKEYYTKLVEEEKKAADSLKKRNRTFKDSLPDDLKRRRDSLQKGFEVTRPSKTTDSLLKLIPPKK